MFPLSSRQLLLQAPAQARPVSSRAQPGQVRRPVPIDIYLPRPSPSSSFPSYSRPHPTHQPTFHPLNQPASKDQSLDHLDLVTPQTQHHHVGTTFQSRLCRPGPRHLPSQGEAQTELCRRSWRQERQRPWYVIAPKPPLSHDPALARVPRSTANLSCSYTEAEGIDLQIAIETQKTGWKINTSPSTIEEKEILKKHLTEPPVKRIDLHFPLGMEVTARNLKGVTIKDAMDAIHKAYKKRSDDELDKPYLMGFEWDKEESWTRLVVHLSPNSTQAMSSGGKKKKNKKDEE
ncbi:hypothetical protein CCHR01_18772 [Colletotrichum chrysophilum]|uniref:DUF6699 domain-containing protein n=1 Tax=Colletotrichum chrysophilum TaxID=1836956 RepID=A0AAD9EB54_9PEZI|nr:hypothetical protein CCHR01_18772 [Colletotrichum chrysophilum]